MKSILAMTGFFVAGLTLTVSAQQNTSTPNTTPTGTQKAQQDSLRKYQQMESAQDKSTIRREQVGKPDTDAGRMNNPTMPPGRDDQTNQPVPQPQIDKSQTKTMTTPSGTTKTTTKTQTQTHTPGQQPVKTQTQTKTMTTPNGNTVISERIYYRNHEVKYDSINRPYYIDKNRIYIHRDSLKQHNGNPK